MQGGHLKVNETVRASLGRARRIPATAPAEVQACTAPALRRNAVSTEAVGKMRPYSGEDFRPKSVKAHSVPSPFGSPNSGPKMDDFGGAVFRPGQTVGCGQGVEGRSQNGAQK